MAETLEERECQSCRGCIPDRSMLPRGTPPKKHVFLFF